jgi:hypothetical protein
MDKIVSFSIPKRPRNKYYQNTNSGSFGGGGYISNNGNSPVSPQPITPTDPTLPVSDVSNIEWYNIQNKIVHSYKNEETKEERKDSYGNTMYDEDGNPQMVPVKTYLNTTWITTIENFDYALKDSENYRFVLMRYRKNKREGKKWRIPWFSIKYWNEGDAVQNTVMDIAEADCWWSVSGGETKWWHNSKVEYTDPSGNITYREKTYKDVLPVTEDHIKETGKTMYTPAYIENGNGGSIQVLTAEMYSQLIFKNNHSTKMIVGCAVFKKTGVGAYGWQRVSNIAKIEIRLSKYGALCVRPLK